MKVESAWRTDQQLVAVEPRFSRFARLWLPILAPLCLFFLLAEDVRERESFRFDTPLLLWLHARQWPLFDAVMLGFSRIGGALMLFLAAVLWRLGREARGEARPWDARDRSMGCSKITRTTGEAKPKTSLQACAMRAVRSRALSPGSRATSPR